MKKGQMFSLDFLISLIAITAAVGLLIQTVEINTYNLKEESQFNEIKAIAETAGNLLVSNPDVICMLVDDTETAGGGNVDALGYIPNCLSKMNPLQLGGIPRGQWDEANDRPLRGPAWWWGNKGNNRYAKYVSQDRLGIPNNYECSIELEGGGMQSGDFLAIFGCWDDPTGVENYYSVSREVVVHSIVDDSAVLKSDFEDCMQGDPGCVLIPGTLTITVWKP